MILAIDPGPTKSAWVTYYPITFRIGDFGIGPNGTVLDVIREEFGASDVAIEMVACYGMPVGEEVFDTCRWIGRFEQQALDHTHKRNVGLVYRKDVKLHLCNNMRAKDPNIRQAIIDRFPATGGGKVPQIGIKKQPGPLYGISKDVWQALGVAITYAETKT